MGTPPNLEMMETSVHPSPLLKAPIQLVTDTLLNVWGLFMPSSRGDRAACLMAAGEDEESYSGR